MEKIPPPHPNTHTLLSEAAQGLTNEWCQGVRAVSSEEEEGEAETSHTMLKMENNLIRERRGTSSSGTNASFDGRTVSPTLLV